MGRGRSRANQPRRRARTAAESARLVHGASLWIAEGIARFDDGDELALELVATRLRLLLASDEALPKLCDRLRIDHPTVAVEPEPPDDPRMSFAIGTLPSAISTTRVKLRKFAGMRCLIVDDDSEHITFRWRDLINRLANELMGVHADEEVTAVLDEISTYHVVGRPVAGVMLRTAGVAVLGVAHEVLTAAGETPRFEVPTYEVNGALFYGMQVRGRLKGASPPRAPAA